jgi:hypothetical protein
MCHGLTLWERGMRCPVRDRPFISEERLVEVDAICGNVVIVAAVAVIAVFFVFVREIGRVDVDAAWTRSEDLGWVATVTTLRLSLPFEAAWLGTRLSYAHGLRMQIRVQRSTTGLLGPVAGPGSSAIGGLDRHVVGPVLEIGLGLGRYRRRHFVSGLSDPLKPLLGSGAHPHQGLDQVHGGCQTNRDDAVSDQLLTGCCSLAKKVSNCTN